MLTISAQTIPLTYFIKRVFMQFYYKEGATGFELRRKAAWLVEAEAGTTAVGRRATATITDKNEEESHSNSSGKRLRSGTSPPVADDSTPPLNHRIPLRRRRLRYPTAPQGTLYRCPENEPSPKINPPSPFTVVQGSLDGNCPALKWTYGREEITISVMRMANIIPGDGEGGGDDDADDTNQLFLHLDVSKPGQKESLHFLCALYPDALGIHSVSLLRNADFPSSLDVASTYNGPVFEDLDDTTRDALPNYVEERSVSESLFPFLRAWLYVKDHRNLMRWFKSVGIFISENRKVKDSYVH